MPASGPLVFAEVTRKGDQVHLAYRERGTGHSALIVLTRRGAIQLARALEGTRNTRSTEPAELELVAEVRHGR